MHASLALLGSYIRLDPTFYVGTGGSSLELFVTGSVMKGSWTQDVAEMWRGYRWNPLER